MLGLNHDDIYDPDETEEWIEGKNPEEMIKVIISKGKKRKIRYFKGDIDIREPRVIRAFKKMSDHLKDELYENLLNPTLGAYRDSVMLVYKDIGDFKWIEKYEIKGLNMSDKKYSDLMLFCLEESLQAVSWEIIAESNLSLIEFFQEHFIFLGYPEKHHPYIYEAIASKFLVMLLNKPVDFSEELMFQSYQLCYWINHSMTMSIDTFYDSWSAKSINNLLFGLENQMPKDFSNTVNGKALSLAMNALFNRQNPAKILSTVGFKADSIHLQCFDQLDLSEFGSYTPIEEESNIHYLRTA